jgi:hypothetical protein
VQISLQNLNLSFSFGGKTWSKTGQTMLADNEVFVYIEGKGGINPDDVVHVRVDPSVTSIPANSIYQRKKLTEVELCEGLVEIGEWSFAGCDHSPTHSGPSHILFELLFVSTMTLKALEEPHLLPAS